VTLNGMLIPQPPLFSGYRLNVYAENMNFLPLRINRDEQKCQRNNINNNKRIVINVTF
jgi:hypothetical protein